MPDSLDVGRKNFCADYAVTASNAKLPDATQAALRLAFGVHHAPKDAPQALVGQCNSPAQALAVSIAAGHYKTEYIAACVGKSRTYISLMRSGKRPIPDRLIAPLCAATGTNLLRQYVRLQRAFEQVDETERLAALLRGAA